MGRARQMSEFDRNFMMDLLEKNAELKNALSDSEAEVARLTAQLTLIEQARLAEVIPSGAFQMAESWMTRALHAEAQVAQLHREAERSLSSSKFVKLFQKVTDDTIKSMEVTSCVRVKKDSAK